MKRATFGTMMNLIHKQGRMGSKSLSKEGGAEHTFNYPEEEGAAFGTRVCQHR